MISLKDRIWINFKISKLFIVEKGKRLTKVNSTVGKTPYLSSKNNNNNLDRFIGEDPIFSGGKITVNSNGSVGASFYHSYSFWASDNTNVLTPLFNINDYIGSFLCTVLDKNSFRFGFGRLYSMGQLNNDYIGLPVDSFNQPDWQFMEDYIKQFEETKLLEIQKTDYKEDVKLPDVGEWRSFFYSDLFDLKRGSMTKKPEKSGLIPYVSSSGMNNALTGMYDVIDKHIIDKSLLPLITVANNGSVGSSFIQEIPFAASSDVSLLLPKFTASKEVLVFIKIIIEESKDLYSYGRKWGLDKMRNSELKLPVLDDGSPDFNLIERYIKSLPYSEMI